MKLLLATLVLSVAGMATAQVNVDVLWDYSNPALSEQRFRSALEGASADDRIVLTTQIARTFGLRRELDRSRELLRTLEPDLAGASATARARHALEWGRAHISAVTKPEERTPQNLATARSAYERALAAAREGRLDGLAIDAVHMMAFVDDAPADQLKWGSQALAMVQASEQPAGKAWEASIRNNVALALHQLGRHAEALPHYERALVLREQAGDPRRIHISRWLVARTLRLLGRTDDALALQQRLEADALLGRPDPFVFEELELLHRAQGREERARHYASLQAALRQNAPL
jgi:tetratricopeptide (TPR) repeat protein